MKISRVTGYAAMWVALSSMPRGDVTVTATVDENRITLNETIDFKVTAEESEGYPQIDIAQVKDFTVIAGPAQSSSFQWVNGQMSSSKSLSWTMIPNRAGTLSIPALDVKVDGKIHHLKPITVTVQRRGAPREAVKPREKSGGDTRAPLLFLEAEADKREAYQGEQITVYYRLYTRADLRQYSVERKPQGVGFWQEVLYAPKQPSLRETRVKGVRYHVATLYKIALFPTTTGELVLDPMVLNCTVKLPSRSRFPSLFDEFFSDPFSSRTKQQIVRSDSLTFRVKPVPLVGKPDDYSGAVGEFSLTSFMDTMVTKVNEAVAYTVELTGTGNLSLFQLEEPSFPVGLEVFDPKSSFEKDPFRDEISGTRRWEYILIPRNEGRYFIPRADLTYFNPKQGRWESTSTDVLALSVRPGRATPGEGEGLTKEEIALLGQDIRYIRTDPIRLKPLAQPLVPGRFWWLSLVALVLFAGPGLAETVRSSRQERAATLRARGALRSTRKRLKRVKDTGAFEEVSRGIYGYFADKLGVSGSGLDAGAVRRLLDGKVAAGLIDDLIDVISNCDRASYAPGAAVPSGRDAVELAARVSRLLEEINKQL